MLLAKILLDLVLAEVVEMVSLLPSMLVSLLPSMLLAEVEEPASLVLAEVEGPARLVLSALVQALA